MSNPLMSDLLAPLSFTRGPVMKNRFVLAPLTNWQSHENGDLSDDEFHWLTMCAKGGFGLTMTCASHVQAVGKGFPGQLGIWDDRHIEGLTRLAKAIKTYESVAICQLHHAGMRSPKDIIGTDPVCPSDNQRKSARGLSLDETKNLIDDFIAAAHRAEKAGFDGIELHGAHGYILCQYFSPGINLRDDIYGGSAENRFRILFDIIDGIRAQCGKDFMIGVRLSPERFKLRMAEIIETAQKLMDEGKIDFLDMSLWDIFKDPEEEAFKGQPLISHFANLKRERVRLGVAGNIRTPQQAEQAFHAGADWVMLGRAAILNHDFPRQYGNNPDFTPTPIPVTRQYLKQEGLSQKFIDYYSANWPDYVSD